MKELECPGEFQLLVEEERTYPIGSVATTQLRNYQASSMKCEPLLYMSLLISTTLLFKLSLSWELLC